MRIQSSASSLALAAALSLCVAAGRAQDPPWIVAPAPELVLHGDKAQASFGVVGLDEQSCLTVIQSTLQDPSTKHRIETDLLSADRTGPHAEIVVTRKSTLPGSYQGVVTLAADGQTATESFPLTVYVSSRRHVALGLLAILAGLAVWYFFLVYADHRAARLNALLAVKALRKGLDGLETNLATARDASGLPLAQIGRRLADLAASLDTAKLDSAGILPPKGLFPKPHDPDALKQFLTETAKERAIVQEIAGIGLAGATQMEPPAPPQTYRELDDLALSGTDLAEVRKEVHRILTSPRDGVRTMDAAMQHRLARPHAEREVRLELARLDAWKLVAWFAVALAGGWLVLIAPDPGFGTPTELIQAFFWGLGFPAASTALAGGPGKISEAFKLSAPG